MKRCILSLLICVQILTVKAAELSDSIQLSLLTVTPGTELYSTFGHTAIRLVDYKNGHDVVFNYGTFDFRTPNFYLKFALGLLDYQLSIESFENFKAGCAYENRAVIEQVLNLNSSQKEKMITLLLDNYLPENRKYRYKFFTDNCSTRPRDIISQTLGNSSYLEDTKVEHDKTFRTLFTSYLTDMPWNRFGIELVLGKMTDNKAGFDALFLPDNLKIAIDKAQLNGSALEKSEQLILENQPLENSKTWFTPLAMDILLILICLLIQLKPNWTYWFDNIYFFIFGFLGLFIATLSIASHHEELRWNYVAFLFIPILIFIPFFKERKRKIASSLCFIIIAGAFICIPFVAQSFNPAVLLLSLAVAIRCFFNFAKISRTGVAFFK